MKTNCLAETPCSSYLRGMAHPLSQFSPGRRRRQLLTLLTCCISIASSFVGPSFVVAQAPSANTAGRSQPLPRWVNSSGRLVSYRNFPTNLVLPREVDVWLPPGYDENKTMSYPVVYMQDGQNLFDPDLTMWHKTWAIDKAMVALISSGKTPPAIIVGIWNTPSRTGEYMPQKAAAAAGVVDSSKISNMPGPSTGAIVSDNYLKFLVSEVKPFVDAHYRTAPGRATTFIMGSSMGGLISIYAISEYPDIFGGAACLSTHWPASDGATVTYLKDHLPNPENHRIYFDFGTETLDSNYEPYQNRVDAMMLARGYRQGVNWVTRKFPGAEHSETSWAARVDVPLQFLLAGGSSN